MWGSNRLHITPILKENPKEWTNMEKHVCIECKEKEAHYWDDNYCEDCFRKLLEEDK